MAAMDREVWNGTLAGLGIGADDATFDALCAAYAEPHRHYHTAEHIGACLRLLARLRGSAGNADEIALALFFHDAVYRTRASDNEARSADWADAVLARHGVDAARRARVRGLILATCHNAPAATADEQLLVDIDLAILGAAPAEYDAFEQAIRREYRWVPGFLYRRRRAALLEGFLRRQPIYLSEVLRAERETQARDNLRRAIGALR